MAKIYGYCRISTSRISTVFFCDIMLYDKILVNYFSRGGLEIGNYK